MDDRLASLLPYPVTVRERPGRLNLTAMPVIRPARGSDDLARAARQALGAIPWPARLAGGPAAGEAGQEREAGPELSVTAAADLGAEGYRLVIGSDRIGIAAGGRAGAFYAAQTLRQLLPDDAWRSAPVAGAPWTVPCAEIEDAPALAWRGGHLDVSRHFFTKPEVLRFIDALAAHKLNRLHLHLTDDQGWRVESRRHPRLHLVGSHRARTRISLNGEQPAVYDDIPHGGYYTLADLAEIAAYAAARMVTVVPEIELPGHASALLAALPEMSSAPGRRCRVRADWGVFGDLISPLPATLEFLRDIFRELLDAVPARYVHIGGDECVLDAWRDSPKIDAYRRELGLADAVDLQAWMLREVADMLAGEFGARAVVWDEGFAASRRARREGGAGLRQDTVVMAWRGMGIARLAAEAGHDIIVVPVLPTYFDYAQSGRDDEPAAIGGPIRAEDVAAFEPLPPDWPEQARWRVLGTQFQLWTEYIRNWRSVEYMAFPRGCALAEVAWAGQPAGWSDGGSRPPLRDRLAAQQRRLDAAGIEYRPLAGPLPWQRGGTGPRRHRAGYPVSEVMRSLAAQASREVSGRPE